VTPPTDLADHSAQPLATFGPSVGRRTQGRPDRRHGHVSAHVMHVLRMTRNWEASSGAAYSVDLRESRKVYPRTCVCLRLPNRTPCKPRRWLASAKHATRPASGTVAPRLEIGFEASRAAATGRTCARACRNISTVGTAKGMRCAPQPVVAEDRNLTGEGLWR